MKISHFALCNFSGDNARISPIGINKNTRISYANQRKSKMKTPGRDWQPHAPVFTVLCFPRFEIDALALPRCLSCHFDSPMAGSLAVERVRCLSYGARFWLGTLLTFHQISSLSRFTKSSWLCLCDWRMTSTGKPERDEVACQRVERAK